MGPKELGCVIRKHMKKKTLNLLNLLNLLIIKVLSLSLYGIYENQGSGYPLKVSKVILKWTGPVKILPKRQLDSNLPRQI